MNGLNLKAKEILTFVPAQGKYVEALRFYEEIGFEIDWRDDSIAVVRKDGCRFFLQNISYAGAEENFMMSLEVEDLDAWWQHLESLDLPQLFSGVRLRAPEDYPWGKREIHMIDPCGVLWHIAVNSKK